MSQDMSILQANAMIGEMVTVAPPDGSAPLTGQVSSVQIQSGTPVVTVNGPTYNLSQVTAIAPPVSINTPTASTATANTAQTLIAKHN
jgi:hypothetical protein